MPGEAETVAKSGETKIQNREGLCKMPRAPVGLFPLFLTLWLQTKATGYVCVLPPWQTFPKTIFPHTDLFTKCQYSARIKDTFLTSPCLGKSLTPVEITTEADHGC